MPRTPSGLGLSAPEGSPTGRVPKSLSARAKAGHLQLVQLRAEAPAFSADAGDGVAAQEELVQGREAVQPASAHLRQAVVLQVPATTAHGGEGGPAGGALTFADRPARGQSPCTPRGCTEDLTTVRERMGGLVARACLCSRVSGKDMGEDRRTRQTAVSVQANSGARRARGNILDVTWLADYKGTRCPTGQKGSEHRAQQHLSP